MKGETRIDLVVPVKALGEAKSRLLGAADGGIGNIYAHKALVLAMVIDTVTAALRANAVSTVLVVTPDPVVAGEVEKIGALALRDEPAGGMNAALNHGVRALRRHGLGRTVGALLGDLPALRQDELSAFIVAADGRRAFCPDRKGTGTTLLLSAVGDELRPSFGIGSAKAHRLSNASALQGYWPSLSADVDTLSDLCSVRELQLGARTAATFGVAMTHVHHA